MLFSAYKHLDMVSQGAQLVHKMLLDQPYSSAGFFQVRVSVVDGRHSGHNTGDVVQVCLNHPRMDAELCGPACPCPPQIVEREIDAAGAIQSTLRLAPATERTIVMSSCWKE